MIRRGERSYGILLPHFGKHASGELLLRAAKRIEELGFEAVWVRDHLVYEPAKHEDPDTTHIEPMVVLSALAGVTSKLIFGTATLIPFRHPIHSALLLGSINAFAPGRVIAGWGLGGHEVDFDSVGMGGWDRRVVIKEQIDIMRRLWAGEKFDFDGEFYHFKNVSVRPVPVAANGIPIWYGGASRAAIRRSVEFCDGWLASRTPRRDLADRVARMERLSAKAGRDRPIVAAIPYVSPAMTVEEGASQLNLPQLCAALTKSCLPPPSGAFQTVEDLDGAAIAGPPDVLIEQVEKTHALGAEHYVFDFRTRFADFEACVETVGTQVLPHLRKN